MDERAPQNWTELEGALQDALTQGAPGQQRIAGVILDDPQSTAFRSVGETAARAQVHQSSVVRFATWLGLAGYPALVALCRERLASDAGLVQRFGQAVEHAETGDLLTATLTHEEQNLRTTLSRIEPETWDRAVDLLAHAPRVHVMGLRKCRPVAALMTYLLRLVRSDVHQVAPVTGELVDELRGMRPGDVFVGISISRYTADTVRAFELAGERGLRTIALTDAASSPLARGADVGFLVACDGVTILRSVAAFVALVQALATAVAVRLGHRSRDELEVDERWLDAFGTYES